MKRLAMVMAGLVLVAFLVGPVVASVETAGMLSRESMIGAVGPRGRAEGRGQRGDKGQAAEDVKGRPRLGRLAQRLGMMLIIAAKQGDAALQELVDKAIADRKATIEAESNRVEKFEALIEGVRADKTREELAPEIEALQEATDALQEAAQTLAEDLKAIKDRLEALGVEMPKPPRMGEGRRRGGEGRPAMDDLAPIID